LFSKGDDQIDQLPENDNLDYFYSLGGLEIGKGD
jgi:hypothetical protein